MKLRWYMWRVQWLSWRCARTHYRFMKACVRADKASVDFLALTARLDTYLRAERAKLRDETQ